MQQRNNEIKQCSVSSCIIINKHPKCEVNDFYQKLKSKVTTANNSVAENVRCMHVYLMFFFVAKIFFYFVLAEVLKRIMGTINL